MALNRAISAILPSEAYKDIKERLEEAELYTVFKDDFRYYGVLCDEDVKVVKVGHLKEVSYKSL